MSSIPSFLVLYLHTFLLLFSLPPHPTPTPFPLCKDQSLAKGWGAWNGLCCPITPTENASMGMHVHTLENQTANSDWKHLRIKKKCLILRVMKPSWNPVSIQGNWPWQLAHLEKRRQYWKVLEQRKLPFRWHLFQVLHILSKKRLNFIRHEWNQPFTNWKNLAQHETKSVT